MQRYDLYHAVKIGENKLGEKTELFLRRQLCELIWQKNPEFRNGI